MSNRYKALQTRACDGRFLTELVDLEPSPLLAGQVRIAVTYSSLNYKDAMSATGSKGITKEYPHTLGIDACGEVLESNDPQWQAGDQVLVTGYDLGMNSDGGLAEQLVCPGDWLLARPDNLAAQTAMFLGTAGLTAGLCVAKLEKMMGSLAGKSVLVSGSTGGVGSIAVALLNKMGANVTAVTGKKSRFEWLESIGATTAMATAEKRVLDTKPISKSLYDAAVDSVGGELLGNILKVIHPGGVVACCGMAGGNRFESSVFPFILRGINLLGVDSVDIDREEKLKIWQRFSHEWALSEEVISRITTDISLSDAAPILGNFLKSSVVGRYRVKIA
ncbi:putative quinone oxidoreductase, YhdH/YhfP family [Spongiibacter sp. IMCC21906]|jgi:acrylyl-CoA reductase (NADPH)|uniref:YhdH/YhfP family quinone oxidoreductase n=1 Tax=Spongiibacter sp. IMCC21906 TaxID=1620392 RepID=UPI00062DCA14|nr:YhdH/YhfP family quinone oxidoreductase [Spongiibacter sp. IMCC21906]AKH69770.1 putative quinone oxidoreductase, YhdH/YhfP family [Spongiibacter sp. IMCC21906]